MKDLAAARAQMGGVRLATLTGDLIEATGAMTGGYLETGGRGADSAVQLKRLGEDLREKSGAESAAKAELARLSDEVRKLTEELAKRTGEAQAHTSARGMIEQELTSARQRLSESAKRIQQAKLVHSKAEEALAKATHRAEELSASLAATKETLQKLNEQFYGHLPSALSNKMRALQEAAQVAAEARLTATRDLEAAKGALVAARQAATARAQELEAARAQRVEKEKSLVDLKASVTAAREALEALKTVEAQQMKAVEGQAEKRRQFETKRVTVVDRLARAQETVRQRETMLHTEEIRLAQARQHLEEVEAALKELPPPEANEKPIPADELKRTITTLTAQLEGMGSVNLRALEEVRSGEGPGSRSSTAR